MSAETRHGGGTKVTKLTKITKSLFGFVVFVAFVVFVPSPFAKATGDKPLWRVSPQAQQTPQPQPRPPVFRAGAHYVRVDAYPTGKDGRMIEGLTRDDFEIYEDGKLQAIENAEFITFATWTPDAERKDPRTQQDAYDLLADPTWRAFVIVIDRRAYDMTGQHYMRAPLHQFIDRNLGPRDLFGLLTTENSAADLVFGQQTTVVNAVLDRPEWQQPPSEFDDRFQPYHACGLSSLIPRVRLDDTYLLLEGLVKLLGLVRQEKKIIVFVSNGLSAPGPARGNSQMGLPDMPKIGITNGRIGAVPRPGDRTGGSNASALCSGERMRLTNMDFEQRFRDLLRDARQANVAFYPVSPAGLQGVPFSERGGFDMEAYRAQTMRTDSLRSLASETDGIAIVNTNDLAGGMRRIANDVQSYYVLGYYTTNTTWDGKVRSIKVRLQPKGNSIRARRQYLAPTQAEIAGLANPGSANGGASASSAPPLPADVQAALGALDRQARASDEPALTLLAPPQAFRWRGRANLEPAGLMQFARDERLRVEWQVRRPLDRRTARVLDRRGRPLSVDVPLREGEVPETVIAELPMSAFARADYVLELSVGSGSIVERSLLAFRVR